MVIQRLLREAGRDGVADDLCPVRWAEISGLTTCPLME